MSSSSRPGTTTVALAVDLRVDGARSESSMSVAARCSWLAFGSQLDAAEHEHRRARRDAARDDGELRASSSWETVILSPVPTTVSESII